MYVMKLIFIFCIIFYGSLFSSDKFYYQEDKKIYLYPYNNSLRSSPNIDYYQNEKGLILGVTDKILVKFKSENNIGEYLHEFDLFAHKIINSKTYLVQTKDKNLTLDISNKLNKKDDVLFAQPDFIKKIIKR